VFSKEFCIVLENWFKKTLKTSINLFKSLKVVLIYYFLFDKYYLVLELKKKKILSKIPRRLFDQLTHYNRESSLICLGMHE
jgi:hypothetical protein